MAEFCKKCQKKLFGRAVDQLLEGEICEGCRQSQGIYILMMIHDFEILYIMIYGLFFNDTDFIKLKNYFFSKFQRI